MTAVKNLRGEEQSNMREWNEIREDFPILKEQVNGKPLIYLDNAATTQLPRQVLECMSEHYMKYNANVHRGIHYLSEQSTIHMETTRDKLKQLLNVGDDGEVVFTSGVTESSNLVAQSYLRHILKPGDEVISTELEHHANYVVWQQLCRECGAEFKVIPTIDEELDMNAARAMLSERTKLLAVTAVSNVVGTVVDIETLTEWANEYGIPVYIDAAQGIRHRRFDLSSLKCDFLGFSAHKMMGPTGAGCLFIRKSKLDQMKPYRYGGGMVDIVTKDETTFAGIPARLEAGTPNYSAFIGWGAALDYLMDIGIERMAAYEEQLLQQIEEQLKGIEQVEILGHPSHRAGCISIKIDGVHPYDFASMIDKYGVAVRSGSMCAQPIVHKFGLDTVIRISPAFYNTFEEIEQFADYSRRTISFFNQFNNSHTR